MDKKKLVIKIILIICIIALITGIILIALKNRENKPTNVVSKPLNENVKLEEVFKKIEQLEGMEIIEDTSNYIQEAEEIDFREYDVLEKGAIVNTTDEEINEVWMIKLGSIEQQEDVCRILGTRVQKLKNAFEDDEKQSEILSKAVIKQEDGVVIMVISANAKQIEEAIANEM